MNKVYLANKDGVSVEIRPGINDSPVLIAESLRILAGHWQTQSITTATTTTIISTRPNEAVMLTDIVVILSKKVASATIIVRFSDGVNTINLMTLDAATAAFNFSHPFQGGIRGWKDANFQVVTSHNTTVAVLAGYTNITSRAAQAFGLWNAER